MMRTRRGGTNNVASTSPMLRSKIDFVDLFRGEGQGRAQRDPVGIKTGNGSLSTGDLIF